MPDTTIKRAFELEDMHRRLPGPSPHVRTEIHNLPTVVIPVREFDGEDHAKEPTAQVEVVAASDDVWAILRSTEVGRDRQPYIAIERQRMSWSILIHPDKGDPAIRITINDGGEVIAEPGDRTYHLLDDKIIVD